MISRADSNSDSVEKVPGAGAPRAVDLTHFTHSSNHTENYATRDDVASLDRYFVMGALITSL